MLSRKNTCFNIFVDYVNEQFKKAIIIFYFSFLNDAKKVLHESFIKA